MPRSSPFTIALSSAEEAELRRRAGTLDRFVQIVGDVTNRAELDEALARFQ